MIALQSPAPGNFVQLPTIGDKLKALQVEARRLRNDHRRIGVDSRNKLSHLLGVINRNPERIGVGACHRALRHVERLNQSAVHPHEPMQYEHLDFYSLGDDDLESTLPTAEEIQTIRREIARELRLDKIAAAHNRTEMSHEDRWEALEENLSEQYPVAHLRTDERDPDGYVGRWDRLEDKLP